MPMITYPFSHFSKTVTFLARQAFLNATVFRGNTFFALFSDLLFVFLSIEVWQALYASKETSLVTESQLITYVVLARLLPNVMMEFVDTVQQRILSGEIASELLRPIRFSVYLLGLEIGRYGHRFLLQVLPIALLIHGLIGINLPTSGLYMALFVISLVFSFLLMFYINYIISLLAFWYTQVFSINTIKNQTVRFLSGIYVPLWFFPEWAVPIVQSLPFASIVYIPMQIYLQTCTLPQAVAYLGLQWFWTICMIVLAHWIWSRAVKQISINGG